MKKWLKRIVLVLFSLILLFVVIFYRPDLKISKVKSLYLTEYSHEVELNILSLSGSSLSIDIHYMDLGNPSLPVIFLIHGAFSSSHTFLPWALELVDEGYRVILMDLPYFGLSGVFKDYITSYRRSAEVVNALINHLDITKIHIGGNSLGGAVSWFFASEYPSKIESLILIDAVPPLIQNRTISPILKTPVVSSFISQFTPRFLLKSILKTAYGDPKALDETTIDRYYTILRKEHTRQNILRVTYEDEPEFGYENRLLSIQAPIYVMWGEKDSWIPLDAYDYFISALNLPSSRHISFPELGHVPMEELPSTVSYYILFLNSI